VAGFTLVEFIIGTGIAGTILTVILALVLYSGRNFAALANYANLQATSLNAIDRVSKDIRQMDALTAYSTNSLSFRVGASGTLQFTYSPSGRTLTRTMNGTSTVLLSECDSLAFYVYQRTPMSGTWDQFGITSTNESKVVQVKWKCSRTIFGQKVNTEEEQTSRIVIRTN